jgi:hypothetical protein
MRRLCLLFAGIVLAVPLVGCGESQEEGPITYKGTDTPAIRKQLELQSENMKNKASITKSPEEKPAPKKDSEKKSTSDPAPATKK